MLIVFWRRSFSLILLGGGVLLAGLCAGCASHSKFSNVEKAKLRLQMGVGYLRSRQIPEAHAEFLKASRLDQTNIQVHNYLGLTYFARQHYVLSEEHFQKSIALGGGSEAQINLARLCIERHRFSEALVLLKTVLSDLEYPQPQRAHVNLGLAYLGLHRIGEAQKEFERALQVNAKFCPAYNHLGKLLFQEGKFREATMRLNHAIKVCPSWDGLYYWGAKAHAQRGHTDLAIKRLKKIIRYQDGPYFSRARELMVELRTSAILAHPTGEHTIPNKRRQL